MSRKIETSDIERRLQAARSSVREVGFPALLASIDRGAFGTTPLNLETLRALAESLACAQAASAVGKADNLFLAYVLTMETSDRLAAIGDPAPPAEQKDSLPGEQYRDLVRAREPGEVFQAVLRDCRNFVGFYSDHPRSDKRLSRDTEALSCLRSYFALLSTTIRKLGPEKLELKLDTPRLRFDGWKVSPAEIGEANDLLPIKFEDIVGNESFVKMGRRLARDVAGFDLSRGENPKKVRNQVLFVLGTPGCGKTVTAHAILGYFLELCEKHGLPAKTRIIRRTDWASSYQNASAQRLLEIFRDEVFNVPGVCAAYWPDIDTAFSARSDSGLRQEEKANLGTLFGILDGTVGPKNGKWFLLCDANTINMDEAVLSRLSQTPLRAHGPVKPADFVRLLRDVKLRGKKKWLPLSEKQWKAIGDRCVSAKLSGRSIDAIAGRVLTEIEDFDEPDEYFSLPFDEKRKMIEKLSRPVPNKRLVEIISAHCRFEKDAQEKSAQERFKRRVEEIHLHLSAQRAALGSLGRAAAKAKRKAPPRGAGGGRS